MANVKISQLPLATSPLDSTVEMPVVQGGVTKRAPVNTIGFLQSGAGATLRTAQAKMQDVVSVKDFGAVGDGVTNDTTAIQAAINAAAGRAIYFPSGIYLINAALTVAVPCVLFGDGPAKTVVRQTNATANGINFAFPSLVQGGGVQNLSVEAGAGWVTSGFQGSGSTGIGIAVTNSNGKFYATQFGVHNFDRGLQINGSFYPFFSDFEVLYCTTYGVNIAKSGATIGAGMWLSSAKISNFGFSGTNTASIGIKHDAGGGEFFEFLDVTTFNQGILVKPAPGDQVLYGFWSNVLADTCISDCWTFDGTDGLVWSTQLTGCWGAFSTNGAGLKTLGTNLDSLRWNGGRLRENGTNGWQHSGGNNVNVLGAEIASNSKLSANTFAGVQIDAGVSQWGIEACRIGNYASGLTGQADNINIATGASNNYQIVGNDLRNAGAGKSPMVNGANGATRVIANNIPLQAAGVNATAAVALSGGSASTPAAGGTFFLGAAGSYASVDANPFTAITLGVVTGFRVAVTVAPGAAQTFTYTIMQNGVATSMTGAISGAASFQVIVNSNAFVVAAGDRITMRLVTSAGAALSLHNFAIVLEP